MTRSLELLLLCALVAGSSHALSATEASSPEGRESNGRSGIDSDPGPFMHPIDYQDNAPLVAMKRGGERLQYGLYRERGAARARNIVPDFSRAGYLGGGVSLPARSSIPVHAILAPHAGGDDYPRIQAAIDAVAARPADSRGLRGVILLQRGHYTLSRTLVIRSGGVVLRGEGRSNDGTVIRSAIRGRRGPIIDVGDYEQRMPRADRDARRTAIALD